MVDISCGKYVNIGIIQNFSRRKYYIFSMCSTPVPLEFRAGFALYQRSHLHAAPEVSILVSVDAAPGAKSAPKTALTAANPLRRHRFEPE